MDAAALTKRAGAGVGASSEALSTVARWTAVARQSRDPSLIARMEYDDFAS